MTTEKKREKWQTYSLHWSAVG